MTWERGKQEVAHLMALLPNEKQTVPDSFPLGNGTNCPSSGPVEVDGERWKVT